MATGGKGRPTPKRSEARATRRKTVAPAPSNRKEAARLRRTRDRTDRAAAMAALRAGDDSRMPEFFRGPEKAAVRDAVDGRRTIGFLALPAFLLNVGAFAAPTAGLQAAFAYGSLTLILVVVMDCVRTARRVRATLAEKFPDGTKERRGSLVRYGLARSFQRRSRRLPPPRVAAG